MRSNTFHVYEHWRPDKDVCFYVGKGSRKRAFSLTRKENKHHQRIVAKLARLGMCVEVRLVGSALSEPAAFSLEIERIAFWRSVGANIVNRTSGGEGAVGCSRSIETRAKIGIAQKGRPKPTMRGKKLSAEHRAKIRAANIGRRVSQETRDKISAAQKGKHRPELIGRKLSAEGLERLRNRVFTVEHRAKISAAKKGVKSKRAIANVVVL